MSSDSEQATATGGSVHPDPAVITHADEVDQAHIERLEADVEFAAAERMTFFSDAVVAIALTLLALELPVPEGDSVHEVLRGMRDGLGEYVAFVISFAVISRHWRTHHQIFRYVNRVSRPLIVLNIGWLFLIVITPWSTKLLSAGQINLLRFAQYAAIQTVQYVLMIFMIRMLMRSDLLHAGTNLIRLREALWRVWPVGAGFAISIPFYLLPPALGLTPYLGYVLWGIFPTVFGFLGRTSRIRSAAGLPPAGARR